MDELIQVFEETLVFEKALFALPPWRQRGYLIFFHRRNNRKPKPHALRRVCRKY
jgi:hypothetical protein